MTTHRDDRLLDGLHDSLLIARPDFDQVGEQISLKLYRLLALGKPVAPERLAEETGCSTGVVERVLGNWTGVFRDGDLVVAYSGLDLRPTGHRLEIAGRVLYNWCAWDSLFIPELLGTEGRYSGRCPLTETAIRLEIAPGSISSADPSTMALSFAKPEAPFGSDVVAKFCCHIHFFETIDAARAWMVDRPALMAMPLESGLALARRQNRARYPSLSLAP